MLRRRAGIAIVAALGGIVVIGALIAGVFFVSTQENQISGGALVHERAFRAAELGLNTTLHKWDAPAMASLGVGEMATVVFSDTGWVDTVVVTKLTSQAYSLLSTATAGSGRLARSRKRTLLSIRLSSPNFNFLGALTLRGGLQIGGNSEVDGNNSNPEGWGECDDATGSMPGIAMPNPDSIEYSGCPDDGCIHGDPPVLAEPAADDTTNYFKFGDEDWQSLTAAADKVINGNNTYNGINPVVTDGVCMTGQTLNWGAPVHTDPANACENFFPIIYAKSNSSGVLKLSGGKGQGILLVDGDLEISGGFEFTGPVIVRGRIKAVGTAGGGKLTGAVMAANVLIEDDSQVLGDATIAYSSCAISKAIEGSANPRRLVERAWTEVN
jgi:hypothetical protein